MALQDQINAIVAQQGGTETEDDLLTSPVVDQTDASSSNTCERVELESGTVAFHKPFAGVAVRLADDYGHSDPDQVPIQEVAAWRLAAALGEPVSRLVCVCVLRSIDDEPGSLSLLVSGATGSYEDSRMDTLARHTSTGAFFDSLTAQQDRHSGNLLYSADALGLIDHGFTFALPGHYCNASHLVQWRFTNGDPTLTTWERDALTRLLRTDLLGGLRAILHTDRADALADRARRMLASNQILRMGVF